MHSDLYNDDMPEWEFEVLHKSRPPLRWVANMCGSVAGWAVLNASYLDEKGKFNWAYKVYEKIYAGFMPVYDKYGTVYVMKSEIDYLD